MSRTAARALSFAGLAGFGLAHWMAMVEPAAPLRGLAALALAMVAVARPVLLLGAVPGVLLVAGAAPADLLPWNWGALAASLSAGVAGVGGALVPYGGSDPDIRFAIVLGGALLVFSAGLLAQQSRAAGLLSLGFLYGIPAVAVGFELEFARGALLVVLVLAYLRLERLRPRDLVPAGALAAAGAVVALAAAPALDGDDPWFDYEAFASDQAGAKSTEFRWAHDYGALLWPRDGREVLQVESPRRTYWKAETLDLFDGVTWMRNPSAGAPRAPQNIGVDPANVERWSFDISVSVRSLRSDTMPVAAVAEDVRMDGLTPNLEANGVWDAGRDLHRGDSYTARVYVPDPSRAELAAATTGYPDPILDELTFTVIEAGGPESLRVPGFGALPLDDRGESGMETVRDSSLGRVWGLARELRIGAATPFDYVRAVQRHLAEGFAYDERPPPAAGTLDGFLFDARLGFCQHYSGAMALLLRMGGVPARVATGFAPGSYNERVDRYVVRDLDAHSWVEAWFAGIGWVVFDPTPAAAPPRSQALPGAITASVGDIRDRGTTTAPVGPAPGDGRGPLLAIAAVLVAAGVVALWLRRPRRGAQGSEFERALRGAGVTLAPDTTLLTLEHTLGPGAADYVRALRAQRYRGGPGPTADERRRLRRALGHGRGPLARARTWLVLH